MIQPAIKITNVTKTFQIPREKNDSFREYFIKLKFKTSYQTFRALNRINLKVQPGEWLGLIGANGSGKSTLLKIIAGIYEPNTGQIEVNGWLVPFLELGVGFNPELSAADNIFLNGTILGLSRKKIKQEFNRIVGFAEVKRFINLKLKNFSSGMQVRLAFAIATLCPGDIFLLDEVMAVGDYRFQQKARGVFTQMKRAKKTVILVSHNLENIKELCDRAVLLDQGRIKTTGKPNVVVSRYLNS